MVLHRSHMRLKALDTLQSLCEEVFTPKVDVLYVRQRTG
jgi:hypothetical protein